eukprot:8534329-Alexandrium_andersonii.AAC.1
MRAGRRWRYLSVRSLVLLSVVGCAARLVSEGLVSVVGFPPSCRVLALPMLLPCFLPSATATLTAWGGAYAPSVGNSLGISRPSTLPRCPCGTSPGSRA